MTVNFVDVFVKSEFVDDFKKITHDNHINSVLEPGIYRFDILQDEKDPSHFVLYETFDSDEAIQAHRETEHYSRWRDTVAPWMDRPRNGTRFKMIFPTEIQK